MISLGVTVLICGMIAGCGAGDGARSTDAAESVTITDTEATTEDVVDDADAESTESDDASEALSVGDVYDEMHGIDSADTATTEDADVTSTEDAEATTEAADESATEAATEDATIDPLNTGTDKGQVYVSELTGLPTSVSIQNQRPIAVMVDNDERALPHYGLSEADVVYEMMNSTANNRITRFMAVYKDWKNIDRIGSIRSTRSTNPMLAAEWNAVLIHDGGPYYINTYLNQPWARHLSGSFSRIKNGKATEFTEYVSKGEVSKRLKAAGYSESYDKYKNADATHFNFGAVNLSYGLPATSVSIPFPHNKAQLKYNAKTASYDYYEYGKIHQDAEDKATLSFTNVILQDVTFAQLDKNGYLVYNVIGEGLGYYMTGGYTIPIKWSKASETDITRFYDSTGKEITINAGKTYIGLVPSDSWSQLSIQ